MASTTIKDGFAGGSDNQLKVNSDGSINVNSSGGGGSSNVSIVEGGNTATVTPSGALTVTEAGFSSLSPGSPSQVPVSTTSTQLLAANPNRKYAHIYNNSGQQIFIQYSAQAAANQGIRLFPNSLFTIQSNNLWLGAVNAVGVASGQLIDVLEGE